MRHSLCFILFCAVLALTAACTKPDRSEEADRLCEELMEMGVENPEGAVERVDSDSKQAFSRRYVPTPLKPSSMRMRDADGWRPITL